MGYDVAVASNGEEALDLCLKGSFDIVFTALKMPGMGGLNLSLQIKAASKRLLPLFHHSLNPKGILFLGTSETIGEFTTLFSSLNDKWKIYSAQSRHPFPVAANGLSIFFSRA